MQALDVKGEDKGGAAHVAKDENLILHTESHEYRKAVIILESFTLAAGRDPGITGTAGNVLSLLSYCFFLANVLMIQSCTLYPGRMPPFCLPMYFLRRFSVLVLWIGVS